MSFEQVSEFCLGDPHVPESALDMAAKLFVDTLAVAAGAAQMDAGQIARNHAAKFLSAPKQGDQATMLFDGRRASLVGASYALATQIDNLDAHDGYNPTKGHIGCAVVPALCAFAEGTPLLSSREALTSLVISYEVAARAGMSLHATTSDYHTSGAWNALGVAALGCRLRRHHAETLRHALGIAEYHGPRSQMMREIANPSMLHDGSGMGAMVGVMAVLLAEDAFEGAPAITLEDAAVAPYWSDLGEHWTIEDNYIKPYPICRWAHAALDALALVVKRDAISTDEIARIDVRTFTEAAALFTGLPETSSQAQYSLAFALAALLIHGEIGPDHVQGQGLRNAQVAKLIPRISVHEDRRHSERFPQSRWSDVTVHLSSGTVLHSGDVHAKGGPEAPMSEADFDAKLDTMTRALGPARQTEFKALRQMLLDPASRFKDCLDLLFAPVAGDANG